MNLVDTASLNVTGAEQVGPYVLRIAFGDGTQRMIDFEPFLRGHHNPLIRAFLDPKRFAGFKIQDGDLMWGDYELIFPVADLYDGVL